MLLTIKISQWSHVIWLKCVWIWFSLLAHWCCHTLFKLLMNDDTPQPWRIVLVSKTGLKWRIRWGGMCEIRGPNASCPLRSRNIKLPFIKTGWQKWQFLVRHTQTNMTQRWRTMKMSIMRTESFEYIEYHVFSPEKKTPTVISHVSSRASEEISTISRPIKSQRSQYELKHELKGTLLKVNFLNLSEYIINPSSKMCFLSYIFVMLYILLYLYICFIEFF